MIERISNSSPRPTGTLGLSWPLLIAAVSLITILTAMRFDGTFRDPDTYWHLAAGRWILDHGTVPQIDPFSHSLPGTPWMAHEWLSEVIFASIFQLAGWTGLVAITALSFACVLAYLNRFLLTRLEPIHALLLTVITAGMLQGHLHTRPHVLVWPLLALWVGKLIDASEHRRPPPWWLVPLMGLWANLHGSFTFGLALGSALAIDALINSPASERRTAAIRWSVFIGLSVAATLLTPWGWHGLMHPFQIMSMEYALDWINEWSSPDFHRLQMFELWLIMLLAITSMGRLRLPWPRLLLLLGLIHLALVHQRHISILGLVAPFLMAASLAIGQKHTQHTASNASTLDRVFLALAPPARRATILVTFLLVSLLIGSIPADRFAPASANTPEAALQAAMNAGAKGPVLNTYNFGGYLIYKGIPVFIDGRADMYGDVLFKKYREALSLHNGDDFLQLLKDYRIGWTMLQPDTPAVALLDRLPSWQRVYADDVAVVHAKKQLSTL